MKKVFMMFFIMIFLAGCANNQDQSGENMHGDNGAAIQSKKISQTEEIERRNEKINERAVKYSFPVDAKPVGNAEVTISTSGGTYDDGNVPVILVAKDSILSQPSMKLENFHRDKEVFIYVNKKFVQKEKVGEIVQTNLHIEGELLNPGTYTVAAIQFENNNPNGTVVNYTEATYELKAGA